MKKAVLSAIAISAALIGCAANTVKKESIAISHHSQYYDPNTLRHKGVKNIKENERSYLYECEQNVQIVAKYDQQKDLAELNIVAPSLGLSSQEVQLKLAVSGSGERYLNDKNPASIYEWHTKGSEGILTIVANGKEYRYTCEAKYSHSE